MYTMRMNIQTAATVVMDFLKRKGYRPAGSTTDQLTYVFSVLDYLDDMGEDYTLDDWFRDTKLNYPEDLVEV